MNPAGARPTLLTPSGIAAASLNNLKKSVPSAVRQTAARAILRHGIHLTDHTEARRTNGLSSLYIHLHGRGDINGVELREQRQVIADLQDDVLDAITALDRADGGISTLLRSPGFQPSINMGAENVTVDLIVSPRELLEAEKELSKALALITQSFAQDIVIPHMFRFNQRCIIEGVIAPPAPPEGQSLKLKGNSHLPAAVPENGINVRCQCRPGGARELLQDMAIADMSTRTPSNLPTVAVQDRHHLHANVTLRARKGHDSDIIDDGFSGALISIGPRTDAVLDRFQLQAQEIPALRVLSQSERSSKWEEVLRSEKFAYSYEIASTVSEAMCADLGLSRARTKVQPRPRLSTLTLILLALVGVAVALVLTS
ncbi:hypothetical protein DXG01_003559 [Tephrocybe rancida]|nr:hypothetical protein DXG01_003559 [Tephrocybe rancida]